MMFLMEDGRLYVCRKNEDGQLGDPNISCRSLFPIPVPGLPEVNQGVTTPWLSPQTAPSMDGDGMAAEMSELVPQQPPSPLPPSSYLPEFLLLFPGIIFSMVLCKRGKLYGWGHNASRQLGISNHKKRTFPELINFFTVDPCLAELGPVNPEISEIFDIWSIACSGNAAFVLTSEGSWGNKRIGPVLDQNWLYLKEDRESKWRLPVAWWMWERVFKWLWLGRLGHQGREEGGREDSFFGHCHWRF
jgi:hypothetical protein